MNPEQSLSLKMIDWIEQAISSKINNIEILKGATSTTLYKLTTSLGEYVLRIYDNEDWLKSEPDLARHEGESLKRAGKVKSRLIHIPKVIKIDETGDASGMPAVLMEFVPGRVDLEPLDLNQWLKELASILAQLHQTDPQDFNWSFFRYTKPSELKVPSWTKHPDFWKKGIDLVKTTPPLYKETFIHRDYHPVNVLWHDSKITSVVDWVNACRGPAGIDVGHCRNNLVCLFGVEAADTFLKYYQFFAGNAFTYDPYWDLVCYFDFVYPGPPGTYQGWQDFGLTHLNDQMITERLEHYFTTLVL